MKFTPMQSEMIRHRRGSLLVSAAAGSGKTTTMVEHIIDRLRDAENPGDLSRMIVVTYTNAAASEMRLKLTKALEAAAEQPGFSRLRRQFTLIPEAHICTVDSLCGYLVRSYFENLSCAPDVRILQKGELELMAEEVMDELFEEEYAEKSEEFYTLLDSYSSLKDDQKLKKMIRNLYESAQNDPFPEAWLRGSAEAFPADDEAFLAEPWLGFVDKELKDTAEGILDKILLLRESLDTEAAYKAYQINLKDETILRNILAQPDYETRRLALLGAAFDKNTAIKEDPELTDYIKKNRGSKSAASGYLSEFGKLCGRHLRPLAEELPAVRLTEAPRRELIRLTEKFSRLFAAKKREKNAASFMDIEHLALSLLVRDESFAPTPLAAEIRSQFDEIIVDEYQDINRVQETILYSLSGETEGRPNMFMVGDIKQSIYRFRRAKPDIFVRKYAEFSEEAGADHRKLDLGQNFRSRRTVLDTANRIFRALMTPALGGVVYDEHAALVPGAEYPGTDEPAELLIAETGGSKEDKIRAEARMLARRIHTLLDEKLLISDGEGQRPLRLGDITILMRGLNGSECFAEELKKAGIPAAAAEKKGFFDTEEIRTVLALLKLLDNPRQDIPLAAVLSSPLFGFSDDELAEIRIFAREEAVPRREGFYGQLLCCAEKKPESFGRVAAFLAQLEAWRDEADICSVSELIRKILRDTSYELYLRSMPGGSVRLANIGLLIELASGYEENGFSGLCRFCRFIERQRDLEVDMGGASAFGDDENILHIDTIHSSKGLEYPVVILAKAAAGFNRESLKSDCLTHDEGGTALITRDGGRKLRQKNLFYRYLAERIGQEELAEELRILYVALTRAREKLIISAAVDSFEEEENRWTAARLNKGKPVRPYMSEHADSYLDWILMCRAAGFLPELKTEVSSEQPGVFEAEQALTVKELHETLESLKAERTDLPLSEAEAELEKRIVWRYPHENLRGYKGVYSVSELKKLAQKERPSVETEEEAEKTTPVGFTEKHGKTPEKKGISAAERGTAYHKLLEQLPFEQIRQKADVSKRIEELEKAGKLSREEAQAIRPEEIEAFVHSPLGQRIGAAKAAGKLYREQPFIMEIPLRELTAEAAPGDTIMIQGIIDLYFEEEGELVLVDYKTNRVRRAEALTEAYEIQLRYYKKALEQSLAVPVKECLIYSFALGKAVSVDKTG